MNIYWKHLGSGHTELLLLKEKKRTVFQRLCAFVILRGQAQQSKNGHIFACQL